MADLDGGDIFFNIRGDASDLEDAINRSQDALGDLEGGADTASDSLGSMGKTAGQVSSALKGASRGGVAGLSSAVSAINPAAGRAIRGLSGLKKAFAAGAATVGPLLIALAAVAAAVKLFQDHQEDLDRRLEISKDVADEMAAAELRLRDAYEQNLVAVGDLSDAELKVLTIRRQAFAENQPKVKALNALIAEQIKRVEKDKGAFEDLNESQRNFKQLQGLLTDGLQKEQAELERLQGQRDAAIETMRDTVDLQIENIKLTEGQTAASTAQADADNAAAEATKARADAERDRILNMVMLEDVADTSNAMIDQTVAQLDAAFTEIEMLALRDQQAIQGGISDSLGAVASLSTTLSDKLAEDNKKAALALFRTSQAAGLSQVAVNTAVAITKALAELGPIAGPIAGVGLGLAGAAQAAIIAAQPPPAHMGDPLAPDERQVSGRRVLATEAVLDSATTRRMGGEDGLRQAMRGGGGGQPVQVNLTYKHLDREVARLMRSNSRTRRAVRS